MAIIPPFFMNAVVSLGVIRPDGNKAWIGTGFLVGRKETTDESKSTVYIITNKHVVRGHNALLVRFNRQNDVGVQDMVMSLSTSGKIEYSEHPNPDVDVVAIQILPQVILAKKLSLSFINLSDHTLTLEKMQATGVDEGSLVYALGFPMNLVNEEVKAPICRLGCISRIADAFINPQSASLYLVDAQVFPGNSGGPIINRPEYISIDGTPSNSSANLIGILSAYIPYRDTLVSQQTQQTIMIREENSGLTIVHPVDRIKEVVELEWNRIETIKAEAQKQKENGTSAEVAV